MGEAWGGGDRQPAETAATRRTERVPVAVPEPGSGSGSRKGRVGLNVPQVAGSAVAAVVAAKAASNLGVYGTIVGAGVVSVLGTCGGSILQHVFQRTGRRVQEAAVQVRRVPPGTATTRIQEVTPPAAPGVRPPAATRLLPPASEQPGTAEFSDLDAEPLAAGLTAGRSGTPAHPHAEPPAAESGGYGAATSYRVRRRGWKRPVVAVGLAFGLTMGGITAYEAIAGEDLGGNGHGTTIGNAFTGHTSSHSGGDGGGSSPEQDTAPSPGDTRTPERGDRGDGTPTPTHRPTAPATEAPTTAPATPTPAPTTTPPASASPTDPAEPTAPGENSPADPTP